MEMAIQRRLEQYSGGSSSTFTIFRVPAHAREDNRKLYEPRLLVIGPYYRGRDELCAMEQHKWRYLRHFLQRAATVPLSDFVGAVRAVEARARCCYSENQIPFFVFERLFHAFFRGAVAPEMLVTLLLLNLRPNGIVFPKEPSCPAPPAAGKIDHLLHLFHEAFVPKLDGDAAPSSSSPPLPLVIPCVTRLREAGVRFVEKASPRDMFDISFCRKNGVMEMPPVAIDQASLPLLVNLVAFEQSRGQTTGPLTSYTALLSSLLRTGADVDELQRAGIIDNMLASDDDAASGFFQPLGDCSTMNYNEHMFGALFADVKHYHDTSWHRHKARFLRDHCSNPWSVIALVLAVLAFLFSLFNQLVAIYGLIHHN